jgi:glycosyltransferase involved in cell wall biosynthesis
MSTNDNKLFSIIIPVYQAKETLEDCVSSCLSQRYVEPSEMEIILVDDGSTDGSSELCNELVNKYDGERCHMEAVHTANSGVSHARNIGIEKATGRFLVFVDSDDCVKENFLETMMKYADEGTALIDETRSYQGSTKISGFQYLENSVLNANTHVWGKLFSREVINENNIRFPEGLTIGEDLLFLIDLAISQEKKHTIRCIAEDDYIYTDNPEGAMNRAFKESYLDQITCWKMAEERIAAVREHLSPYTFVTLAVDQIMTALLVAGKLAASEDMEDKGLRDLALSQTAEQINHALKTRGAFAALSSGHKLKVMVFRLSRELYLKLYCRIKNR